MAAEVLSAAGHRVTVYERLASPGRKLLMAGRGGLNLTHSEPLPDFLACYGDAAPWLTPSIKAFPPEDAVAWAEGLGQETFTGSSGRVFPKAMKASPLLRAWLRRLEAQGVTFRLSHRWTGWTAGGELQFCLAEGETVTVSADAVLLALGGASWPRLGTDGSWEPILKEAQVPIATLAASNAGALVPWTEHIRERFHGQALKRIALTVAGTNQRGEAVITRSGLEGGAVYALSGDIRRATTGGHTAILLIDLKPDDSTDDLTRRLAKPRGKMSMANFLRKAVALSPQAIALLREGQRGAALPAEPDALAALIKAVPLTVTGLAGLERAISTAGGVHLDALDSGLMLKARPGVFAAGEMLDWDAPTGGYLLQACLATGVAAAKGMLAWLELQEDTGRG